MRARLALFTSMCLPAACKFADWFAWSPPCSVGSLESWDDPSKWRRIVLSLGLTHQQRSKIIELRSGIFRKLDE